MFVEETEIVLNAPHHNKSIAVDAKWTFSGKPMPVILFIHGFKGFKDWGPFNLMAKAFAKNGFMFIKMNLSHNGVGLRSPREINDLEAFSKNNFSIELEDIQVVIDHLFSPNCLFPFIDLGKIYLLGHSRGGGLSMLKAAEETRIKKTVAWAPILSVHHLFRNFSLEDWEKDGKITIVNARTKQELSVGWQLMEDYWQHAERLDILNAARQLKKLLLIYATDDLAIPFNGAQIFMQEAPNAATMIVERTGHTFGGEEPFSGDVLPSPLDKVIERTIGFFQG